MDRSSSICSRYEDISQKGKSINMYLLSKNLTKAFFIPQHFGQQYPHLRLQTPGLLCDRGKLPFTFQTVWLEETCEIGQHDSMDFNDFPLWPVPSRWGIHVLTTLLLQCGILQGVQLKLQEVIMGSTLGFTRKQEDVLVVPLAPAHTEPASFGSSPASAV